MASPILPGCLSRHSTRIPQPPLYPADLTTTAIPGQSHSRHYTQPISQPPLYSADLTAAIIHGRSHSRHPTRSISQPPFYPTDLTAAILPGQSHNRHSICPTFHLLRIFHTRHLPPDGRGEYLWPTIHASPE